MIIKTLSIAALFTLVIFCTTAILFAGRSKGDTVDSSRTPVLVELFTSEGCSSCPPADRLLEKLDEQPIAGVELIVLSEHVDYWNHIGWKDPYSARFYSERQSAYGRHFRLDSVYTPQMVVDGTSEFVGSNASLANKAFGKALHTRKISVRLSSITVAPDRIGAHVETGNLDAGYSTREAEVYLAIALNHAQSQVSSGENAGHRLEHVAVVRGITRIGTLKQGQSLSQEVQWKLDTGIDRSNLRLIAFLQETNQGRVLGATEAGVNAK
jgi:hypothetical protein